MQAVPLLAPCELARRRLRRLCGLRPAVAGAATPASLRPCRASNPAVCRAQVSLHLYLMKVRYKNPEKRIMKTKDGGILRCAQNDKMSLVQRFPRATQSFRGLPKDAWDCNNCAFRHPPR